MWKRLALPLLIGVVGLVTLGCESRVRKVGVTSYSPDADIPAYAKKSTLPPITQPKEEDIRKTGTGEWNTGRATQPQPKALEKDFLVRGTVAAAGAGSISVTVDGGGQRNFQTDENTFIFSAGDPRFFAKPMPGPGATVTVQGYNKNGTDYAARISIGEGDFSTPPKKAGKEK